MHNTSCTHPPHPPRFFNTPYAQLFQRRVVKLSQECDRDYLPHQKGNNLQSSQVQSTLHSRFPSETQGSYHARHSVTNLPLRLPPRLEIAKCLFDTWFYKASLTPHPTLSSGMLSHLLPLQLHGVMLQAQEAQQHPHLPQSAAVMSGPPLHQASRQPTPPPSTAPDNL
jgi:hypothetical protein